MSAKTKIIVLRMKELVCAGIFAGAGLILIVLLMLLFLPGGGTSPSESSPKEKNIQKTTELSTPENRPFLEQVSSPAGIIQESAPACTYVPGIYKTELLLGGQSIEVEAVLEKDHIASLRLVNLDEAVTTMYPLLEPAMDSICQQVYDTQSLNGITYSPSARYTSLVLLEAIRSCLDKAAISEACE